MNKHFLTNTFNDSIVKTENCVSAKKLIFCEFAII